jgi:hypothetical protein
VHVSFFWAYHFSRLSKLRSAVRHAPCSVIRHTMYLSLLHLQRIRYFEQNYANTKNPLETYVSQKMPQIIPEYTNHFCTCSQREISSTCYLIKSFVQGNRQLYSSLIKLEDYITTALDKGWPFFFSTSWRMPPSFLWCSSFKQRCNETHQTWQWISSLTMGYLVN